MAANGNDTGETTTTTTVGTCNSSAIIHGLQDLTLSTRNATQQGALSSQTTPALLSPAPPQANRAVDVMMTSVVVQTRAVITSSCSKGSDNSKTMAAKLDRLRRRRLLQRPRPKPSIDSITDELQNVMVGAAAFRPTALELVGCFLLPRVAGQPLPRAARFIHDADVYASAPDHLAATHAPAPPGPAKAGVRSRLVWYFFSPLHYQTDREQKRTACRHVRGSGTWKATGARWRLAKEGKAANWYGLGFVYCELRHGGGSSEWRMREYGIAQQDDSLLQPPLVVCEVFRSPSSW